MYTTHGYVQSSCTPRRLEKQVKFCVFERQIFNNNIWPLLYGYLDTSIEKNTRN